MFPVARRTAALVLATSAVAGATACGGGSPAPVAPSPSRAAPGPSPTGPADPPVVALPTGAVRTIATKLRVPWGLAFLPDGTALVTERGNRVPGDDGAPRILSVTPAGQVAEVQRLPEVSDRRGEGGLLGIAVSPRYANDKWVYVYYSTETDNRVARLRLGQPPQPILTGIPVADDQGGRYHQGGRIAFGPDGMLYASTGDAWLTRDIAQDPRSLGGKILRVTPDGRPAPGNPFGNSPVYSIGHRNVQGLAWDARGRMYASEFGEDLCDELNVIEPGRNYGWPVVEGPSSDPRFVNPIASWCPTPQASPSGIAVLGDHVYLACLHGQRLYRVGLDGGGHAALLLRTHGRLRTVEKAPDGSLWVLTSNRDGRGVSDGRGPPSTDDDQIVRVTV